MTSEGFVGDLFQGPTPKTRDEKNLEVVKEYFSKLAEILHLPKFSSLVHSSGGGLEDALAHLVRDIREGTHCPVCTRFIQLYRRNITSAMARCVLALYRIWRTKGDVWTHVLETIPYEERSGDYGKLLWGLIEEKRSPKEDGNPEAGFYRITALGREFALDKIRVPKYKFCMMDDVIDWQEEGVELTVSIREALGDKFDYFKALNA